MGMSKNEMNTTISPSIIKYGSKKKFTGNFCILTADHTYTNLTSPNVISYNVFSRYLGDLFLVGKKSYNVILFVKKPKELFLSLKITLGEGLQ